MYNIPEPDWKVFKRVHAAALARFCEQVLAEVQRLAQEGSRSPHERYLEVYQLMKERDRQMGRIFDNPRRSVALHMLAQLRGNGLLPDEDLASLSANTRDAIGLLLGHLPG